MAAAARAGEARAVVETAVAAAVAQLPACSLCRKLLAAVAAAVVQLPQGSLCRTLLAAGVAAA
eukprot:SAG11_NODE_16866_length_535_cov_0.561927_1_plen_62_part_10